MSRRSERTSTNRHLLRCLARKSSYFDACLVIGPKKYFEPTKKQKRNKLKQNKFDGCLVTAYKQIHIRAQARAVKTPACWIALFLTA